MDIERGDLDSNCWECSDDAITWVNMSDGLRRYFCEEHVRPIFRHNVDPGDLDDHPTCVHCRSCGRLTLRKYCPTNTCPECKSDTDAHAEEFFEAIENAADEFSEAEAVLTDEDGVTVEDD